MQGPLGPDGLVEPGPVDAEHLTVEKEQGAQGLVLGGGGDLPLNGERGQEWIRAIEYRMRSLLELSAHQTKSIQCVEGIV
jgi:hypothetical protein